MHGHGIAGALWVIGRQAGLLRPLVTAAIASLMTIAAAYRKSRSALEQCSGGGLARESTCDETL